MTLGKATGYGLTGAHRIAAKSIRNDTPRCEVEELKMRFSNKIIFEHGFHSSKSSFLFRIISNTYGRNLGVIFLRGIFAKQMFLKKKPKMSLL